MKVVFVSNYFNHHQKTFSEELYKRIGAGYSFISTAPMREERRALGYSDNDEPSYVLRSYTDKGAEDRAKELINSADAVIAGNCPKGLLASRINSGGVVFRYSERPFKKEVSLAKRIYYSLKWKSDTKHKNVYLLSAGHYTFSDYSSLGIYKNRAFKWGYFPETRFYDLPQLMSEKTKGRILWCGRFIHWKHPEIGLRVAKQLKDAGYDFSLDFIGTGEMEEQLKQQAAEMGLNENVTFCGAVPPQGVREAMEKSSIFLFTSNRQEGWGAVLNEAMNSGCAVVASCSAGATTYLAEDGKNCLVFDPERELELFEKVKWLLDNPPDCVRLGENGYNTITSLWNGEIAAERFLLLAERILKGQSALDLFDRGPCSRADK